MINSTLSGHTRSRYISRIIDYLPTLVNTTRLVIAMAVLIFHLLLETVISTTEFASVSSITIYAWVGIYSVMIVLMIFYPAWQKTMFVLSPVGLFDILMMAILMHLFGGIHTGFGILILPFVATSCVSSGGRNALAYASFASILILSSTIFYTNIEPDTINHQYSDVRLLLQAASYSIACFFVALLSAYSSLSLRHTLEAIVASEAEIEQLHLLNELVLEHAQEGIVVVNKDGKVFLHNKKAQDFFPMLHKKDVIDELMPIITRRHNTEQTLRTFNDNIMVKDEEILITSTLLLEQEPPLLLMFLRSSDEVARESQAIKLAALGKLTANLAHEIRNPLSAISHANELLQENDDNEDNRYLRKIIEQNVNRINKMVEEILSLNRRDRTSPQIIDFKSYFNEFLTEFTLANPEALHKIHSFWPDTSCFIAFDRDHLHQVLNNLLNNAWKYSKQDENAICLYILADDDGEQPQWLLRICDNGAGIDPKYENYIFEPFFTTSPSGTGLGLYVARELAQANGGNLQYNAETGAFELLLRKENHE